MPCLDRSEPFFGAWRMTGARSRPLPPHFRHLQAPSGQLCDYAEPLSHRQKRPHLTRSEPPDGPASTLSM